MYGYIISSMMAFSVSANTRSSVCSASTRWTEVTDKVKQEQGELIKYPAVATFYSEWQLLVYVFDFATILWVSLE